MNYPAARPMQSIEDFLDMRLTFAAAFLMVFLLSAPAFAAHPLITDDTGTQGRALSQLELNGEAARDFDAGETEGEVEAIFSYGLSEKTDIVLSVPYAVGGNGGFSDAAVEVKWRFFEGGPLSFALKPGITLPTGEAEGGDEISYGASLIITREAEPLAAHTNFIYSRSGGEDIVGASFAVEAGVVERLRAVFDIAAEGSLDSDEAPPASVIGGVIYAMSDELEIDCGVRVGITEPADDLAILFGAAWRF